MLRFLKPLIAACALAAGLAHAAFPERPITLVVPYAPGGAADAVARVVATRLGAKLGGSVIVENRAGASGTIGGSFVARASADGYTMLSDPTPHSINPHLFPKMPYAANALQPLSLVLLAPNVLIVKADAPYKNVGGGRGGGHDGAPPAPAGGARPGWRAAPGRGGGRPGGGGGESEGCGAGLRRPPPPPPPPHV